MRQNQSTRPFAHPPRTGLAARFGVALACIAWLGGCASYEYDIVKPAELARHVGSAEWASVVREPLEYRLRTVENRLVMEIYNRSPQRIQLVGQRSAVVDPSGQSHPLAPQPIEPDSFIKLILPPMPARATNTGPRFGVGIGIGSAYRPGYYPYGYAGSGFSDVWYDEPRYYSIYDPNDPTYWEWTGEGEARLTLVFEQADQTFTHEWTLARKKK